MVLVRRATLAVAAALMLFAPSAAQAARLTHNDAIHDVVGENDQSVTRPSISDGDISQFYVNHGMTNVLVKVSFVKLLPDVHHGHFLAFWINTNEGINRRAVVNWYPGRSPWLEWHYKGGDGTPRCSGLKFKIDYAASFVLLTVPRTCLSMPLKVRAGAAYHRALHTSPSDWVVDDANRTGGPVTYIGTLGGWVRRA